MSGKKTRKGGELHALPKQRPNYKKKPHDCQHAGTKFAIAGTVNPLIAFDREIGPTDPNRQVVGYALVIGDVKCDECGQPFRFVNLPTKGNPAAGPLMSNRNLQLQTPVEPDLKIISPDGRLLVPS